ncbi:GAF domain-containing protein [Hymenobacter lutimineralis]|uniref:GAF domain-containing protein n=1 Tax=Hymenobacter lutimineralis TaxID=2606448 RepID=A0A5D6UTJ2_9BACT|nr:MULTISPECIES: GAF domain-containing protein [Hymenobacter]QIX62625.1 GAF domain-containing protein [Hymenobacter sp. BT18]TYZ06410.1 GAF domain-containing protein [Hymenobacter lutimineralis]
MTTTATLERPASTGFFPFKTSLSFEPLIRYWESRQQDANQGTAMLAKAIMTQVEQAAWSRGNITDLRDLECGCDLTETLMLAVFPPASFDTDISGVTPPFTRYSFYQTPRFAEVLLNANHSVKQPLNVDAATMEIYMARMAYMLILDKVYGVKLPLNSTIIFTVPDYSIGLYRHYGVEFNSTFVEVQVVDTAPELTSEQIEYLSHNLHRLDVWKEVLPPEHFELSGFNIIHLVDVTDQEILSELKYDLLERDVLQASDRLEQIQEKLRVLFGRPFLQLGIAAYDEKKRAFVDFGRKINHSFITKQLAKQQEASAGFRQLYARLLIDRQPLVLENVETADLPEDLRQQILALGIRSAILALLPYGDDTVGLLELGSPQVGDLDEFCLEKVNQFVPLFAVAVKRNAEEIQTRVQAIVKEKFTAIHPTMEWRFTDAALNLLSQLEDGNKNAEMEDIVFHEVYPLHGSSDIRGSSTARNEAIQGDLIEHLTLANKALKKASELQALPILDELKFYVNKNLRRLRQGLVTGDEVTILDSLRTQVEPLFEYLAQNTPELRPVIGEYWNNIDPELGILYKRRKAFEQSVTMLNDMVSDYLDEEEQKAQQMFPHYFQRFKTDGVEFNIYVGASLVENKPFDLIFLKNLRLWQLLAMVEITRRTAALKKQLPLPLETTQLVLVHGQPLSIRFRQDERQFDVDGAYNIRYEIIKKRIDKATVQGTGERLTQPGLLALVYSQAREATEYMEYIDYLQDRNLLEPEVEELELEELQGVKGLLALRVKVKL